MKPVKATPRTRSVSICQSVLTGLDQHSRRESFKWTACVRILLRLQWYSARGCGVRQYQSNSFQTRRGLNVFQLWNSETVRTQCLTFITLTSHFLFQTLYYYIILQRYHPIIFLGTVKNHHHGWTIHSLVCSQHQ